MMRFGPLILRDRSDQFGVIPAEAQGREPESIAPRLWLWIRVRRFASLRGAPE